MRPLPWLAALAAALWGALPFTLAGQRLFGLGVGDGVKVAWQYAWFARTARQGGDLTVLSDFSHPAPEAVSAQLPNLADALLFSPVYAALPYPQSWNATMAACGALNALGLAVLARALGCRGLGIPMAAALGVGCLPAWEAAYQGRMNVAVPGLCAMAVGAWALSFEPESPPARGLAWAGLASLSGAFAALIYPPYLAVVAPVGLFIALAQLRRAPRWGLALALLAPALALAWDWDALLRLAQSGSSGARDCALDSCPARQSYLQLRDWWSLDPTRFGLSTPLPLGSWALAPLALLARPRLVAPVLAWMGVLLLLSLGPCQGGPSWAPMWRAHQDLWCALSRVHEYVRFGHMAQLLAGALSALALEGLLNLARARGPALRWALSALALALALALGATAHTLRYAQRLLQDPVRWSRIEPTLAETFLQSAGPGASAELPFDAKGQARSVLMAPGRARVNPMLWHRPSARQAADSTLSWLLALGLGQPASPPEQPSDRWVRWIIWDPSRCADALPSACDPSVPAALRETLGSPLDLGQGVMVWDLSNKTNP